MRNDLLRATLVLALFIGVLLLETDTFSWVMVVLSALNLARAWYYRDLPPLNPQFRADVDKSIHLQDFDPATADKPIDRAPYDADRRKEQYYADLLKRAPSDRRAAIELRNRLRFEVKLAPRARRRTEESPLTLSARTEALKEIDRYMTVRQTQLAEVEQILDRQRVGIRWRDQNVPKPFAFLLLAVAAFAGAAYTLHGKSPAPAPPRPAPIVDHQLADSLPQVEIKPTAKIQRVMDEAGFLSPQDDPVGFEGYLKGINEESGVDIRWIFVPAVRGDIAAYARDRARDLGLGRDMNRRSMLFVYDVANQRMRIEVGPELEGMFPDGFVGDLLREQMATLLAVGRKKMAVKTTLDVVNYRLREASLGKTYNPRAVAYISDKTRLAAGAGATAHAVVGTNGRPFGERIATDEARNYFGPQPTPADAFARYHEALHDGHFEPDLPLYTPQTQMRLRAIPIGRPFADFILLAEHGQGYKIVERGDLAILFFTTTPLVSPHLFRRAPAGWQLDLDAEVRDTREFVGGSYTWSIMPSGDDYTRTFANLFADFGADMHPDRPGFRPGPTRTLRLADGDNRPLPTRREEDAPVARTALARNESLLLPVDDSSLEDLGYPVQTIDQLAVRKLLISQSYDQLDTLLSAYSDSAASDYRLEYRLFDAYEAFAVAIPSLEPLLNDWVERQPKSAPARLARAVYLTERGWNARGTKESNETSRYQFQQMNAFFARATPDYYMGAHLDPRSIVPYRGLMSIAMNEPDHAMGRLLLDRGLKIQPYSFRLRATYIQSLLPRWGGSYRQVRDFAAECAPYAAKNPRIKAFAGYEDWDRGRVLEDKKDYAAAEAAYTRALNAADWAEYRYDRGEFYWRHDRFREALEDLNRAIVQRPQDDRTLYWRSRVKYALGYYGSGEERRRMFTESYDDIALAMEINPADEWNQKQLAFVRENIPSFAPPPRQ